MTPTEFARKASKAKAEAQNVFFHRLLLHAQLPAPTREFVFARPRLWRFDYAWEAEMVALEVEGGAFAGGRHTRGAGFRSDLEKYNTAALRGWRVLRVLPEQLCTSDTIGMLEQVVPRIGGVHAARAG